MSITLDFTGIAVWVFFINANNAGITVTTMTLANFTLDDQPPRLYQHVPDMTRTGNDFNAVAYQQDGLTNTPHRLLISTTGDSDAYVNFDFAIYSFDDEIPPLTSSQVQSPNAISSITTSPTAMATEVPDPDVLARLEIAEAKVADMARFP
ncbi:hypothetical protein NLJ89_g3494 [Agrocybe chaxingu]|uniref:Uncharacterized protein n=1 Tax=Agrocybe chaxingu TaxID=84603 RepID=A0A9W8KAZ4_9AGAR|nr:hypothetical protein NLJ89_g3494 [Agrocybe chaxingu]